MDLIVCYILSILYSYEHCFLVLCYTVTSTESSTHIGYNLILWHLIHTSYVFNISFTMLTILKVRTSQKFFYNDKSLSWCLNFFFVNWYFNVVCTHFYLFWKVKFGRLHKPLTEKSQALTWILSFLPFMMHNFYWFITVGIIFIGK